jgi:hypothetical protein
MLHWPTLQNKKPWTISTLLQSQKRICPLRQRPGLRQKQSILPLPSLKPNEAYPKDKMLEIEKIVADLAKQKALDDQYAGIIANADKLLAGENIC